jgi:hypothetical protein
MLRRVECSVVTDILQNRGSSETSQFNCLFLKMKDFPASKETVALGFSETSVFTSLRDVKGLDDFY